jgi:hypothetical protein
MRTLTFTTIIAIIVALLLPPNARAADAPSAIAATVPHATTRDSPLLGRALRPMPARLLRPASVPVVLMPFIRPTLLISIPFGLEPSPHLGNDGGPIFVDGHGGCTAGEIVGIQVTVTQSTTGALATGDTQEICTGELQQWSVRAAADGADRFAAGPARACGVATTRSEGQITDTFEWCRDITLVYAVYLPIVPGPG